jgi:A/G-specific adenine glycosylase
MEQYSGKLPSDPGELMKLPGIGKYSSSAIAAFAHNLPALFIETNIRRVFIHFFFRNKENIRDSQIMPFLESTLDTSSPREWYYALMDYGAMLKKAFPNSNRKSAHYRKQTRFHGSNRQIRGMVLKTLLINPDCTKRELLRIPGVDPKRLEDSLEQLLKEGFMKKKGSRFFIE